MEGLEQRLLLAGDVAPWQNALLPEDVNADSIVGVADVLYIAYELHQTGSRSLLADAPIEPSSAAPAAATIAVGAEGEATPPLYLDVNGDNYLTPADAILVITRLNAEGQADLIQMRFEVTDTSGTPIDSIDVGGSFNLNVYVQDIRPDTVPDRGVYSVYLDIFYDSSLISVAGSIVYSPDYSLAKDQSNASTPGEIQDAGNAQTNIFGGPLGPGEFLLLTVPFTADAAPILAVNDDAGTDAALNISEDSPGALLDVLANDTLSGTADLYGAPGNNTPLTDVLFYSDPSNPVSPDDIIYGSDTIQINAGSSLEITEVGPTSNGGTAVIAAGGTRIEYVPPAGSNGLGADETAIDSFSYTISNGSATATATVTVTIVGQNDDPIAQDVSLDADEDTPVHGTLAPLASDPDLNDSLSFSAGASSALGAAVTVNPNGTFTYDPRVSPTLNALPAGVSDTDTFSYTVSDGNGGSGTATVIFTVVGRNDLPVANDDSGTGFTTDEDTPLVTGNVLANDTDVDGDPLSVTAPDTTGTLGLVTDNGDGTFGYNPNGQFDWLGAGQTTTDGFTYTITDGKGGSDTATVTITITGLDDPPVANDDFGSEFTTDQDTPLVTGNVLANDTDAEGSPLSITAINTTSTVGQVTDNGDGTFGYNPNGKFTYLGLGQITTDSFTYTIRDGSGSSATATVFITVTGLNDPPTAYDGNLTTNEDMPLSQSLAGLGVDLDVSDILIFSGGPSSAWGASVTISPNGMLTYDPTGSPALQGVLGGETAYDTVSFTVSDGKASDSGQVTITVLGRNDPPVAQDDNLVVEEQSTDNVLDVLANDFDVDAGDALAITAVGPTSQGGTATAAADGLSIIYTPAPGLVGTETFTYTVRDATGATATATVEVEVEALTIPRARNDSFTVAEDSQDNNLDVFANDLINVGGIAEITLSGTPDHGGTVVVIGLTTIQYSPAPDFFGTETFRYTLSDGIGDPEEAVVTVKVTGINDPPVASDDSGEGFTTDEDSPFLTANVLANDTDVDGDVLSIAGFDTTGTLGLVTNNGDGTFGYDPDGQFNFLEPGHTAEVSFTYTVSDGKGGSDTATVVITITGLNDPPVANDDSGPGFTTDQDSAFVTANVLANDSDAEGDSLSIDAIDTTGTLGLVTDNHDGTFGYDPNAQFDFLGPGQTAADSFTYTVGDGNGGTDTATVTITVTGLNDPPVASDDSGAGFTTDEDTVFVTASVLANDSDVDGGTLSVSSIDTTGTLGQVTDNGDGTFTYDPTGFQALGAGQPTTDSFTYTLGDGQGGFDTATVTITINGINDAPVAADDSGPEFATDQNTAFVAGNVLTNDSDAEGDPLLILAIDTTGTLGQVTDKYDGTFGYNPNGQFDFLGDGQTGYDTFSYTVDDGNGGTATATVTITVTGLNDVPTAEDVTFDTTEDAPVGDSLASKAHDPDGNDTLTFSGPATSDLGAAISLSANGTLYYNPLASSTLQALLPGGTLVDWFSYTVTDGSGVTASGIVTINVSGVNDNPTAVDDSFSGILEDSSGNVLDVLANDSSDPEPGETLTIASVGPTSAGGTVVIEGENQLRYTPAPDFFGTETFLYTIGDGHGGSASATVSVAVTPQNDPPTATDDDQYSFVSGSGSYTLDVLANDTIAPDVGETLTITAVTSPNQGGTVVNQGGNLLYTPPGGIQGKITETFSYTISDSNGGNDTATVTVEVTGFTPSTLSGSVFTDKNGDGLQGDGERGIGDVSVTLTGADIFGQSVLLTTTTARDGSYSFGGLVPLVPGDYTISAEQPAFLQDGPERIGTQGGNDSINNQLSVSIGVTGGVAGQHNNFGELGLQPQYISVWDFLNSSSRQGILFATDSQSGQMWYSFLDGWDDFTSATAVISADGSTLEITLVDQSSQAWTLSVPLAESRSLHIRGKVGTQYLVQLVGPASTFTLSQASTAAAAIWGMSAEGEGTSAMAAEYVAQQQPLETTVASVNATPVTAPGSTGELGVLAAGLVAEQSLTFPPTYGASEGAAEVVGLGDERTASPLPPFAPGNLTDQGLAAVDAAFGSIDEDAWEPLFDEPLQPEPQDALAGLTQQVLLDWDELPV